MEPTSQIFLAGALMAGAYAAAKALGRLARRRRDEFAELARKAAASRAEKNRPRDLGMLQPNEQGIYVPENRHR